MRVRAWWRDMFSDDARADPRELRLMAVGVTIGAALFTAYACLLGHGSSRGAALFGWLWAAWLWTNWLWRRRR